MWQAGRQGRPHVKKKTKEENEIFHKTSLSFEFFCPYFLYTDTFSL